MSSSIAPNIVRATSHTGFGFMIANPPRCTSIVPDASYAASVIVASSDASNHQVAPACIYLRQPAMFNLFRKKWTVEETANAFPQWERSVTVCLCTKLRAELIARGFPDEPSNAISAQGVNYITGVDWEASVNNLSAEIRSVVEVHKSDVEPAIRTFLAKDKSAREVVVYFLRIKTVMLAAMYGFNVWAQDPMKGRIEQILYIYGPEFPERS